METRWDLVKKTELKKLVEFDKHLFPKSEQVPLDQYQTFHERGLEFHVLKNRKGVWVGVFQIWRQSTQMNFFGFGVTPKFRKRGFGKKLLSEIKRLSYGTLPIACKVRPDNYPMKSLLKEHGFYNKLDEYKEGEYWQVWQYDPVIKVKKEKDA